MSSAILSAFGSLSRYQCSLEVEIAVHDSLRGCHAVAMERLG